MPRYSETTSVLGSRIMDYRKARNLTQADVAERYGVSGPAIFKFEKGFVTPSLRLWLKIAAGIGIPEKEAVLVWVREKIPSNMRSLVGEASELDVPALQAELLALGTGADASKKAREVLADNPDLSPILKRFVLAPEFWDVIRPSIKEMLFLVDLTQKAVIHRVEQLRDALMVGRAIQHPED